MPTTITPLLMFSGKASEAMTFYTSLFADGKIIASELYGADQGASFGKVKQASFSIAGQTFCCMDSPVEHDFSFTPSISIFVDCTSEQQIKDLAAALGEDGAAFIPLGAYVLARQFAWVQDRFGVCWQLSLT